MNDATVHITIAIDYEMHADGLWCVVYHVRRYEDVEIGRQLLSGVN